MEFFNDQTNLTDYIDCKVHNVCPVCNHIMQPEILLLQKRAKYEKEKINIPHKVGEPGYRFENIMVGFLTDIVMKCTAYDCENIYIVHYESDMRGIRQSVCDSKLLGFSPSIKPSLVINENLTDVSEEFYSIYKEALIAENAGLSQICGMGYRKALEFLVKDYVIFIKKLTLENQDTIIKKDLGKILAQDIDNARIVSMARRAAWIGNDEAHYKRKWLEKDTQDLKAIINVIVNEMENEIIFRKTMEDMPSGR